MEKVLFVAVLCSWAGSTIAQQPAACANVQTGAVLPKIPLPMLPTTAFKSVVRAEVLNKNVTVEATEYVDESVNAAAIVMTQNGQTSTIIMSYLTNEVFYVVPDSSSILPTAGPMMCIARNLSSDDSTQLFGMNTDSSGGYPHLYSTSKILNFINGTEVYKGSTTVGGVPANKWSSCVYWSQMNANFTLDYYFTVPGWQTPSGLDQIPLRAEVQGQRSYPNGTVTYYHHIYQYVNFEPYVNDPETVFTTPPGVYCLARKATRQPPKLNDYFYYREEISNPGASDGGLPVIAENDIWYDYDLQLVRFDSRSTFTGVSKDFTLSNGPYHTIHDYGLGVQYTIADDTKQCSIDPIPVDARGFDAVYNITRQTLGMRKPLQFLNLDSKSYLYAGRRKARGQQCDVFQAVLTNIPGHGIVVYEVYFLTPATEVVPDRGSSDTANYKAVPMRILIWESGQLTEQYEIHDFDQYAPHSNIFDVTPCFPGQSSTDFQIILKLQDTKMMPQLAPFVNQLMQLEVSINAGITPVRLQRTRLTWNNRAAFFEGTLLDVAPALAKYEITKGFTMTSGLGTTVQSIMSATDCAAQCDQYRAWTCAQFDYCASTQVCTLGKAVTTPGVNLRNSSQCDHYQRVLSTSFDIQTPLSTVWTSLKNRVFGNKITISLPLPDPMGNVDLSVDTSKLDTTQKVTLQAVGITDQVVSTVNRNPGTSSTLTQFQVLPGKSGKGFDTVLQGLSVDDCASSCVDEETYNCQSFRYCWNAGTCFLSRLHPDERPNMLRDNSACDLYVRDYTSNYQKFDGLTVLSASPIIYQNVLTTSQCAKLCTYYSGFHCESFDFCTDVNTCFLGQVHYYDAPKANIKQVPACVHYSRSYIQDFVSRVHRQVPLRDNRVIQDVTPQQCAKLCVQEGSFTCNSFDYCGNFSECRLSDASVANVGQVTLEATASCDVYSRQYSTGGAQTAALSGSSSSSNSSNSFSGGAMAGLAIAMVVIGLILGLVGLVLFNKFRGRGDGDGMAISFTRQENAEA